MSEFKIVSASSHAPRANYYCYQEYFKSLMNFGNTPLILDTKMGKWGGLGTKVKWLYKAIDEKIIDTPLIIYCDCWDLVFAASPDEIIELYRGFDADLVISAEKNCFPSDTKEIFDSDFNYPTSYKYLNSGFIVGKTEALFEVLKAMDLKSMADDYIKEDGSMFHANDQFDFQKMFLRQPVNMKLDAWCQLSQTMEGVTPDELDFMMPQIRNRETNNFPCTFHWNGGSKDKWSREIILKHLNLL